MLEGERRRKYSGGRKEFGKAKTEKIKRVSKSARESLERPVCQTDGERNREGNLEEALRDFQVNDLHGEVLEKLGEYITVVANPIRIKLLAYCLNKHSFTDIILALRLNPASFKHHYGLLHTNGFIEKTTEGRDTRYQTTELGRKMLNFSSDVLAVVRTP